MTQNRLLEYACWRVISKYQDSGGKVSGLRFNKMMSLLNHKLLPKVDIELPRCWYFYGEQVVPRELPVQVRFEGQGEPDAQTAFCWDGNRPKNPPSKGKGRVDSSLDSLYSRFPPQGDVMDAVRAVYEYPPYDFQKAYAKFRSDFQLVSQLDRNGTLRAKLFYPGEFKTAMHLFPVEDFPQLRVPARKLEYLVESVLEEFPNRNDTAVRAAVGFWELFCKLLRVSEKGHKCVTEDRLDLWRRVAEESLQEYMLDFQSRIDDVLSNLKPKRLSDPLLLAFLQPARLGPSFRRLSSEIDQVVYG